MLAGTPQPVPGTGADLGESPVWDPARRRLMWVDLLDGVLHDTDPRTGEDSPLQVDGACGFVALADDGVIHARGSRIVHRSTAASRVLADADPTSALRINDSQVSPGGWLFAGLMHTDRALRAGTGRLIRLEEDGGLTTVATGITVSNGMGWSPDGTAMYYIDLARCTVETFDFDSTTGRATNRQLAFSTADVPGSPDGMAVDSAGRLWIAFWGSSTVRCFDPRGIQLAQVDLPVANVTSCCFGGDDLSTLYVTTSRRGASDDQPQAGAVFAVPTDAVGQQPRRCTQYVKKPRPDLRPSMPAST